ncbi:tetratricopeptide repeat protein [Planctomicrobium sp. SH664]|uniref:tetratricopeptide repeat protein n=1 Tax=Planctomicrobium sp. SH664 TaxID=3448125 RepID=UPI003F5B77F2
MSTNEHFHHAPAPTELEKVLNQGASRIEPYSNQILLLILVVTIAGVGGIIWYRGKSASQEAGWNQYYTRKSAEDFLELADKYPNQPVSNWARLQAGRLFLAEGLNQALTNREVSDERLKKAETAFDSLVKANIPAEIREEALYNIATTREALSNGDNKPAITAYEQLLAEYPDSQHRSWAEARVEALKTNSAEEFYAWFRKQDPKPADRQLPRDVGKLPSLNEAFPDLDLPLGKDSKESTDTTSAPKGTGAPDLPKDAESKPATPSETPRPAPAPDASQPAETKAEEAKTEATAPAPAPAPAGDEKPAEPAAAEGK